MNANESAYPSENDHQSGPHTFHTSGLTKHELIAAMALQALLSNPEAYNGETLREAKKTGFTEHQVFSADAVKFASALILELSKDQPK